MVDWVVVDEDVEYGLVEIFVGDGFGVCYVVDVDGGVGIGCVVEVDGVVVFGGVDLVYCVF